MTTLNSRLQLALLNQKKKRNLLEKGFTLVELMIVIVIVAVRCSCTAELPKQTDKAKATRAKTAMASVLKQAQAGFIENGQAPSVTAGCTGTPATTPTTGTIQDLYGAACPGIQKFDYTATNTGTAPDYDYELTATGNSVDGNLTGKTLLGCINMGTGVIKIQTNLNDTTYADGTTSC